MARKLRLWNGRAYCCRKPSDPFWKGVPHNEGGNAYVAAYSRADVRRVIEEYTGYKPGDTEIREYWSPDCWGNAMDGITPERGLWVSKGNYNEKVTRLV